MLNRLGKCRNVTSKLYASQEVGLFDVRVLWTVRENPGNRLSMRRDIRHAKRTLIRPTVYIIHYTRNDHFPHSSDNLKRNSTSSILHEMQRGRLFSASQQLRHRVFKTAELFDGIMAYEYV